MIIRKGVVYSEAGSSFGPKIVCLVDTSIISRIDAQAANFVWFCEKLPGPEH